VREVVLLGRRGPEHAAYTAPELLALRRLPGVDLVVDDSDPRTGEAIDAAPDGSQAALLQGLPRLTPDLAARPPEGRRIVLRFSSSVVRMLGDDVVRGVCLDDGSEVVAGPVVSAIGYGGHEVPGLPFDAATGTVPHEGGRITGVPGAYAVGWFKRGSSGGIGDNRVDAAETVRALLDDAVAGRLPRRDGSPRRFARAMRWRWATVSTRRAGGTS
jgi:ferredoxin--NADP+ reductase